MTCVCICYKKYNAMQLYKNNIFQWTVNGKKGKKKKPKTPQKKTNRKSGALSSSESEPGEISDKNEVSEPEEGEVSDSDSESGSGSDSGPEEIFQDEFDENLYGDEEDRRKLEQMTEKEREQELFNRGERRQALKIRYTSNLKEAMVLISSKGRQSY